MFCEKKNKNGVQNNCNDLRGRIQSSTMTTRAINFRINGYVISTITQH